MKLPAIIFEKKKLLTIWIFFIIFAVTLRSNSLVQAYEQKQNSWQDIPNYDTAIVFGGGMIDENTMETYQYDRVLVGIGLYKKGIVKKLIMTGDDGARKAKEVQAMKNMAIEHGVPEEDVSVDPHGYRTYLSCLRAKTVYNIDKAIVVSQDFHLARIKYFCENQGIETYTVSADLREYPKEFSTKKIRETLARVKGWWQVEVTKPTT